MGNNTSCMNDILDDVIEEKAIFKIEEVIPLIVLLFFYLVPLTSFVIESSSVFLHKLVCLILIIMLLIIYKFNRKIYFYSALSLLFFEAFVFVHLGWSNSFFTMSIGPISLSIEPLSLVLLVIHLWLFNKELNEIVVEKKKEPNRSQIEKLKKTFQSKSKKELGEIKISSSYRTEAKIAAEELLKEYKEY